LPASADAQAQNEVVAALEFARFLNDRASNLRDVQAPVPGR